MLFTGVAYGRMKQLQADSAVQALTGHVVACLSSSSMQVAQQAGEALGVMLAQLKRAGDSSSMDDPAASNQLKLAVLEKDVRDALRSLLNNPDMRDR